SGYYAYLKRPKKLASRENQALLTRIKRIYTMHKGTLGAKRIAKVLSTSGSAVNHKRVARLMREANLKANVRLPKSTAESKSESAGFVYENHLNRDFDTQFPDTKWVTDMTEIVLEGQKVYISALKDLFNEEVIAFETSSSPNQELICRTIRSAQQNRKLKNLEGVLIHSDRG
ncbi:IS3 family transposase, partial [Siminovitchia sediminis]